MISFGTGGWRAIIADGFTKLNVQRLARALALRMKAEDVQDKSFCIGYQFGLFVSALLDILSKDFACAFGSSLGIPLGDKEIICISRLYVDDLISVSEFLYVFYKYDFHI